jgi:probable HAF family extracellular repeat protein
MNTGMATLMTVTIVGNAPVTGISEAWGINDQGMVVGEEDTVFPFVWRPNAPNGTTGISTRLAMLPHPVQSTGVATAINNAGDVVGSCETVDAMGTTVRRAVLWSGGTGPAIELGTLIPNLLAPGTFLGESRALDINDSGQVVGVSDTITGSAHAFLFDPSVGIMRDLGALVPLSMLPGTPDPSEALAINANGDIVGWATAVDAQGGLVKRAFLFSRGALFMTDLGTLTPDPAVPGAFLGESSAIAINTSGVIVGDSDAPAGPPARTGAFFAAGAAPAGIFPALMTVLDVNDNGLVVGSLGDPPNQAFRFSPTSGVIDLSNVLSGHTIVRAVAINAAGQVAAVANNGTDNLAVLITP